MGAVMLILQLLILIGLAVLGWRVVVLERTLAAVKLPEVTRELAEFRAKAEIISSGRKLLQERLLVHASRAGS